MSYSTDLRERVVDFVNNGGSKAEASRRFKVSRSTVYDWLVLQEETGSLQGVIYKRGANKLDEEALSAYVERYPDHYLYEIGEVFGLSPSGIFRALKRLRITLKKNDTLQRTL